MNIYLYYVYILIFFFLFCFWFIIFIYLFFLFLNVFSSKIFFIHILNIFLYIYIHRFVHTYNYCGYFLLGWHLSSSVSKSSLLSIPANISLYSTQFSLNRTRLSCGSFVRITVNFRISIAFIGSATNFINRRNNVGRWYWGLKLFYSFWLPCMIIV